MNDSEREFLELVEEGWFSVDKQGQVWRHTNGQCRRAEKDGRYKRIAWTNGRKHEVYAHRVVYMALTGEDIPDGKQTNHKDGNKKNNHPDNLEVVTPAENMRHAVQVLGVNRGEKCGAAKLTCNQVRAIRQRYAKGDITQREIAQQYGVHHTLISHIVLLKIWRHVT